MSDQAIPRPWRFALASVIGSSHEKTGSPCQDSSACEINEDDCSPLLVAVVADGAGSAKRSRIGSQVACMVLINEVRALMDEGGCIQDIDRAFAERVVNRFQLVIKRLARRVEHKSRDFACTFLTGIISEERSVFFQIGDGAIVVAARSDSPASYSWIFWPQHGEFCNQTNFATADDALGKLVFAAIEGPIDELALFSDGLENLVLDQAEKVAHATFFEPMFDAVRNSTGGHSEDLSSFLAKYLGSRNIVSRTDDDKTLILATRRPVAPPAPLPVTQVDSEHTLEDAPSDR